MLQLLNAFLPVQALGVVARLGIADELAHGPKSLDHLASVTGAHGPSLYRLLRMLTGEGVFLEEEDGRFALTALGDTLRSDATNSVRDWALYVGTPETWEAWGQLHECVMTGEPGFVIAHGMPTYQYLAQHPELGEPFDRWMTRQSHGHNRAIIEAYDFSQFHTVADIGGGQGSTLAAIVQTNPSLRGILLDQPQVVAHPLPLETADLLSRCEVIGGDMLQGVPGGADAYLIKRVLMILGDEPAIRLLQNCAEAMQKGGKVLVVEMVMPLDNAPSASKPFDLLMMLANAGGRIRTEAEFRDLFAAAGLRLTRSIRTASPNSIIEGMRA
ncbi:MAG: methyltransferase [Chloroflexota bacterium]